MQKSERTHIFTSKSVSILCMSTVDVNEQCEYVVSQINNFRVNAVLKTISYVSDGTYHEFKRILKQRITKHDQTCVHLRVKYELVTLCPYDLMSQ